MNSMKQTILDNIRAFIGQRSGLDFRNYNSRDAAIDDYRKILRHGRIARRLLREIEVGGYSSEELQESARRRFSGRLSVDDSGAVCYCAGQYFPTEYRLACCVVLFDAVQRYYVRNYKSDARRRMVSQFGRGVVNEFWPL